MNQAKDDREATDESHGPWRAGDLLIDLGTGGVERDGATIQVVGLSFDLLVALVRAAPNCLSHDELIDAVWEGRVVSPETIVQRVRLLRDVLSDDAKSPRYIGLVRGRGYRLLPAVQPVNAEGDTPRRSLPLYLIAAAAVLFLALAIFRPGQESVSPDQTLRGGIAVLPFSSQGAAAEGDDFFATGVHDNIIAELAGIEDLLVISRTSVLSYRGVQRPIAEIGRELNVDKILEGSVQRSADKVTINVQLIDAREDRHLWAQGYERDLSVAGVFETQQQIAAAVARELRLLWEMHPDDTLPTESMAAYDYYLAARQALQVASDALQSPGTFSQARQPLSAAVEHARAAIEEDPGFADAHALMSMAYAITYRSGINREQALLNRAAAALVEAVKLGPDRPQVRQASGNYYFAIGEQEKALRDLELAHRGLPHDTDMMMGLAMRYLMAGRAEEARPLAERAASRDPLNYRVLSMLQVIRWFSGDVQGALAANRRTLAVFPDSVSTAYLGASFHFAATADLPAFRKAIETLPVRDAQGVRAHWEAAYLQRDYDAALIVLQGGPAKPWTTFADYTPVSFMAGVTHLAAGNSELAREAMLDARRELEVVRTADPSDPRVLTRLAGVHAGLGEREVARDMVQAVLDSARYRQNALFSRIWRRTLVEALLLNGDHENALDLLEVASRDPDELPVAASAMRPIYDGVRDHPRFQEILRQSANPAPSD
jgi:TolB-like protein/DNA-binding winged helix-turn-helix (wHTH) protein/Flp pilus assembly protein TadD